jgi:hypothetical protein
MVQTERIFTIQRTTQGVVCWVHGGAASGRPLPLRLDLWRANSAFGDRPPGFEFGYAGNGPAQLALALLADCCGDEIALAYHRAFMSAVIAHLPSPGSRLTETFIRDAVTLLRAERAIQQRRNN